MSKSRKSLSKLSRRAFERQAGRCFYCGQPMWLDDPQDFASLYQLSLKQARGFRCTGEHLQAHSEGGRANSSNIVGACRFCNGHRHRAATPKAPKQYRAYVRARISKGKWQQLSGWNEVADGHRLNGH